MMTENTAIDLLKTLTPEHQKQVINFIAALKDCEHLDNASIVDADSSWTADPFFGLWSDRPDIQNSAQWVRQLRQTQWSRS